MAGILDWYGDPNNQGMLALSAGLLQAGGASQMPVGIGQAVGGSVMQGLQAANAAKQQQANQQLAALHALVYGATARKTLAEADKLERAAAAWRSFNAGSDAAPAMAAAPALGSGAPADLPAPGGAPGGAPMPSVVQNGAPPQGLLAYAPPQAPPQALGPQGAAPPQGAMPPQGAPTNFAPSPYGAIEARMRALGSHLIQSGDPDEGNKLLTAANNINPETYTAHNVQTPNGPKVAMVGNKGSMHVTSMSPSSTIPEGFQVGPNGGYTLDPTFRQFKMDVATAQKPQVQVNIDKGLAENVKDIVGASHSQGKQAVQTITTANRIAEAINTGKVNIGPGATIKQTLDQVADTLGITGNDTQERLANTRSTVKGLAEFALGARQSLKGQGAISDFETRMLKQAASGDIDTLTPAELKVILDVTARAAKVQYDEHQRILGVMGKNPEHKALIPYYEVPPLPQYSGITSATPGAATRPPLDSFKR